MRSRIYYSLRRRYNRWFRRTFTSPFYERHITELEDWYREGEELHAQCRSLLGLTRHSMLAFAETAKIALEDRDRFRNLCATVGDKLRSECDVVRRHIPERAEDFLTPEDVSPRLLVACKEIADDLGFTEWGTAEHAEYLFKRLIDKHLPSLREAIAKAEAHQ